VGVKAGLDWCIIELGLIVAVLLLSIFAGVQLLCVRISSISSLQEQ
jgi:hypothetical protein